MDKKQLVLDASFIMKWFTREHGREKALKIRRSFANDETEQRLACLT